MTGPPEAQRARIDLFSIIALILLVLILLWLTYPVLYLFVRSPKEYNEGWNALIAMRAMGDLPLYPQDQTLHTNNYPPLSFYIVGALGTVVGDNIFAGRIVSLASTLAIAGEVAVVVRLLGGCWRAAGFSGLVFLGGLIGLGNRYIGTNDPQLLGHAVMLGGLVALLRRRRGARRIVVAAVMMVAAGLIKHNILALPLAITAWLSLTDRRALAVWLPVAAAALGAALLALWLLYGQPLVDNLVSARSLDLLRMMQVTKHALVPLQVLVLGLLLLVVVRPRDAASQLVATYGACSLAVGVLFAGGAGTGDNLFFDLLIASAIGAGLLIQHAASIAPFSRPGATRAFVAAAYLMAIGVNMPGAPVQLVLGSPIRNAETDTNADLAFLTSIDGRVMCEILALCYWAGKGLEVDSFNARQGFLAAGRDEQVLLDLLATGAFAAVQMTSADPKRDDERFSPAFMERLLQHYSVARSSANGDILVYRGK